MHTLNISFQEPIYNFRFQIQKKKKHCTNETSVLTPGLHFMLG